MTDAQNLSFEVEVAGVVSPRELAIKAGEDVILAAYAAPRLDVPREGRLARLAMARLEDVFAGETVRPRLVGVEIVRCGLRTYASREWDVRLTVELDDGAKRTCDLVTELVREGWGFRLTEAGPRAFDFTVEYPIPTAYNVGMYSKKAIG